MTRKIAIVGNRAFPLDVAIGTQIVDTIRALPEDALILTRGVAGFEEFLKHVCLALGRRCFTYSAHGGGDNFARDRELATDCDELLAFLAPDGLDGRTGAHRVIEEALALKRPVRVATVADGLIVWADA